MTPKLQFKLIDNCKLNDTRLHEIGSSSGSHLEAQKMSLFGHQEYTCLRENNIFRALARIFESVHATHAFPTEGGS